MSEVSGAGVGGATTTAARMPPLAQSGWRWLPLTVGVIVADQLVNCLLYTSPSPRD